MGARISAILLPENNNGRGGDHEIYANVVKDLYRAAQTDNADEVKRIVAPDSLMTDNELVANILSSWSSEAAGNTFLHVAAQYGSSKVVNLIAEKHPSLVLSKNRRSDTALHLAAKSGHEATVKALVGNYKGSMHALLRAGNENGNTALHEALLFNTKNDSIAKYLIQRDPELLFFKNKKQESAMYLAAKAGFKSCISLFRCRGSMDQQRLDDLFENNSPIIMEAIQKKDDTGVLDAIFGISTNFPQFGDGEERNPLHYAASLGYYKMARYFLGKRINYETYRDENGLLPIHLASIEGHVKVVKLLLQHMIPYPEEILDKQGRSILHLAAENGRDNVVKFLINKTSLKYHINMTDKDGNTALHLATKNWKPMIVSTLTWHNRAYIDAVNGQGKTALDVAEANMPRYGTNTQWLTVVALRTAGASRPQSVTSKEEDESDSSNISIYKEKVNFRLLVAILVAAVAFEAGFRLPDEHDNSQASAQYSSMKRMLRRNAFNTYVFSNTIAMYSSIAAAVILSWAQTGDQTLLINALHLTLPSFLLALSMMSLAFTSGVYLKIDRLMWLRVASLGMGVAFHLFLLFNSLVLFSPIVSTNRVLRYLCYYPFRFLVLMNSDWITNNSCLTKFMWSTKH